MGFVRIQFEQQSISTSLISCTANSACQGDDRLLTTLRVDTFGPTLEWYVAQRCQRELHGSAAWLVMPEGLPTGRDFDVLAWLDPLLLHV